MQNIRDVEFNPNVVQVYTEESGYTGYKGFDFTKIDDLESLLKSGINVNITGASVSAINMQGTVTVNNEVEVKNSENDPIPVTIQNINAQTLPLVHEYNLGQVLQSNIWTGEPESLALDQNIPGSAWFLVRFPEASVILSTLNIVAEYVPATQNNFDSNVLPLAWTKDGINFKENINDIEVKSDNYFWFKNPSTSPIKFRLRKIGAFNIACCSPFVFHLPQIANRSILPVPVKVSSLPAVNIAAGQNVGITGVTSLPAVNIAAGQNVGITGVTSLPAVNIAAGQNVGITGSVEVGSLPAVNIAAGQNVGITGVTSLPAVNIAAGQNVGITGSLPAVNIAAGQNVGITGSVAITNTDIVSLKNNFSNVIFSEENSPSGIVVYQANLNKDLDNVTIYTEKSHTISNFTPSSVNGTVLEGNANRKELYIQNLATGSLHIKYGSSASATSFNFVLAGNTSNNAGDGGSLSDQSYTGIVSVSGAVGPSYISWERS